MPSRRSDRGRALAAAVRQGTADTALQFTEPYGTIRGLQDLKDDPSNPWNYLAAVPMLGRAAAFAKAIRKGDYTQLPKDQQWRFDESSTPEDMRKTFAEEYITDLEIEGLEGKALLDEVEELRKTNEDLYNAVGENMPEYMRNVDITEPTTYASLDATAQRWAREDAAEIVQDLMDASPQEVAQTLSDLAQNDPPVLELVKKALDIQ